MAEAGAGPRAGRSGSGSRLLWLLVLLLLWSFSARLLFSWPNPTMNRLWDERYNAGNVAAIVAQNQWRPVRTHYPTLSYLPHALALKLYEAARTLPLLQSSPPSFGLLEDGRPYLRPLGVRVCRSIHALLGTLSLLVLFLIGRLLFGPGTALGAVFLLSIAPWHLRQSGMFKPDIMLVLTAVLALYAMLQVKRRQNLGGYALAGALVGATAAAKWNGAALALPLLVTIGMGGVSDLRRTLLRTVVAAAAGAAVLLGLNPWLLLAPDLYRRHLGSTVSHYRERLAEVGAGFFDQPLSAAASLASTVYFSPVLGTSTLFGLGWLLVLALHSGPRTANALAGTRQGTTIVDAWILLSFVGGYVVALWSVTRYPKPPNWLIIAPVAALAGSWFIGRVFFQTRRIPWAWVRYPAAAIFAAVLVVAGATKVDFVNRAVYDENVPTAAAVAAREAGRNKPLRGRTFITELHLGNQDFDPRVWDPSFLATLIRTESIASEPRPEWEAADVLLFPASRLEPGQESVYEELTADQPGAIVQRFEPSLFRLRGDPVVLVRRPFEALGPPAPAAFSKAGDGLYEVDLAGLRRNDGDVDEARSLVSLEIAVRAPSRDVVGISVEVDGNPLPCRHTQKGRERRRCLTPRLEVPTSPVRIVVQPDREVIDVTGFHWRRPSSSSLR